MTRLLLVSAFAFAFVGCAHDATKHSPGKPGEVKGAAKLDAKSGSSLDGMARFSTDGVKTTALITVKGAPAGKLAVHLHEKGDCSAADASSAGGHWNPKGDAHGKWEHSPFHLGDIGNIDVGENGEGTISLTTELWTIGTGAENDIVGHAVIVHSGVDDFTTQPTGNAGGRIGCGVVKLEDGAAAVTVR